VRGLGRDLFRKEVTGVDGAAVDVVRPRAPDRQRPTDRRVPRVNPAFGTVRVPRLVGAYDVGRVINPKIARSQCIGGMVGGLGMALLEQVEWDARFGRVMNANLAEYLVPVNADVIELDAEFVPSDDRNFNPLGVKGLAEIALCGVAPAIANAVHHATGKRMRELPITPERLLA
jgi:xanthine dehydrogenase YagR molybdenum-binding subunit